MVAYDVPRALDISEIKSLTQQYADAAKNALDAGHTDPNSLTQDLHLENISPCWASISSSSWETGASASRPNISFHVQFEDSTWLLHLGSEIKLEHKLHQQVWRDKVYERRFAVSQLQIRCKKNKPYGKILYIRSKSKRAWIICASTSWKSK